MRSKYNKCYINFDFLQIYLLIPVSLICKLTGQFIVDNLNVATLSCMKSL